ncbi:UDP-N-acetylmuramoyl-tripeptide--D-alanyl-D-alanine ligase [soil metagenome]
MALLIFLALLVSAVAAWRTWRRARFFLHVSQLEGYKTNEYSGWLDGHLRSHVIAPEHVAGLGALILLALSAHQYAFWGGLFALLVWLIAFASSARYDGARQKKPLVFTDRMRRLATATLILGAIPVVMGTTAGADGTARGILPLLAGWLAADLGAPLWVYLGLLITKPIERSYQEGFKRRAKKRLAQRDDLKTIAITGSFGKTSVKFIVAEILKQRYNALATPSSYNTPMGLCIVVNERLRSHHRVLVLEMGARYRGDIRELTDLAPPDIAIVTAVGPAHLETMGPIESIAEEKASIIDGVTEGGQIILNADDPRVAAMAERVPPHASRVWRVSASGAAEADIRATNIHYDATGVLFTVYDDTGDSADVRAQLLGEHNVLNVLLGVAAGRAMGLQLRQIARAIERIEPVEHRLQLKKEGGLTIIDDAFNSNPVGAAAAVEVLGQMPVPQGGRRVIVTPGMIELGPEQESANQQFGRQIAENLKGEGDLAILVGRRQTEPIQAGLRDAGFPEARTRVVRSLFEARDIIKLECQDGDIILYENDLPDHYNEAA